MLQQTAAASLAWVLARHVVDHHEPFFAPIAAVVALNTPLGDRGLNALRLLQGVVVGIVVGESVVALLGSGYGALTLALLVAMTLAQAISTARVVRAQAAVGAVLTVATAQGLVGLQRLLDALLGAGVALVFSQLLFSPEPLALLRRAEAPALAGMARGVELTAQALDRDDVDLAGEALTELRGLRARLNEIARTRQASRRVVRHSMLWRARQQPVVRENENAGHLDLLAGSCQLLARTAMTGDAENRLQLAAGVHELADVLRELADAPLDRNVRQRAADRAFALRQGVLGVSADAPAAPAVALRLVTDDVMIFAGATT